MKARNFLSTLTFLLTAMLIVSCATTPKTQDEIGSVIDLDFITVVKKGHPEVVQRYIEAGADVNAQYHGNIQQ